MANLKLVVIGIILTSITNFPSGFMHTSMNTAVNELNQYLNDSFVARGQTEEGGEYVLLRSVINSCWYAGQVVGALFSPYVTDNYGRKHDSYFISLPEVLILGRILASVFSPMSDTATILYLQRIFSNGLARNGTWNSPCSGPLYYTAVSVPVIPGLLALLFLYFLPETPKFLMISKQNREKASKSLTFFQGAKVENDQILDDYFQEAKNDPLEKGNMLSIITVPHLRKALLLGCLTMVLIFPYYPILQCSTYIFQQINLHSDFAQISSSVIMVCILMAGIFAAILLNLFQRRSLILIFGIGAQISLLVFVDVRLLCL
uniref:Major facilitator superfamily (MFS) profile domain-containing protein n=1 Tax=Ditylenchus dipsaci TaxID=166011 RepID=A0A915DDU2_9BILA